MLTSFDHVTIAVRDLDAAARGYERLLGAAPVWRGEHPELGTEAALFGLTNSLLELVAPRGDAPEAAGLRAWLDARGEGLMALAFGTDDADACTKTLRERGLRVTTPQEGTARASDGSTRHYRTVELSTRLTRGLSVFIVQRPDLATLRGETTRDPSAAHALDHVVVRTSDMEAALALYGQGLGVRLALDRVVGNARMMFFRIGAVTLEVVEDESVGASDAFYGVTYRVRDLERAHERLCEAGFVLSEPRAGLKPGTRVFSVRSGTASVPTLMLRDPSRE